MAIINPCIRFHKETDRQRLIDRRVGPRDCDKVAAEWENLLNLARSESQLQGFLERNPQLLPGLFDLHNGPLHDVIVAKLPFGPDFVSDFAFVTRHSMALQFTFVEIEDPTKAVFTEDDRFTQEFNRARQQLADWKLWTEKNVHSLMDMFNPMFQTYNANDDYKDFKFYLVCGRRCEVESNRRRKERWSSLLSASDDKVRIMSYDRLRTLNEESRDYVVCTYQAREFYAKSSLL